MGLNSSIPIRWGLHWWVYSCGRIVLWTKQLFIQGSSGWRITSRGLWVRTVELVIHSYLSLIYVIITVVYGTRNHRYPFCNLLCVSISIISKRKAPDGTGKRFACLNNQNGQDLFLIPVSQIFLLDNSMSLIVLQR